MALADGNISLWQLGTLSELYRYKHEGPVRGLTFTDTDDFYFFSGRQVPSSVSSTSLVHAFSLTLVHGWSVCTYISLLRTAEPRCLCNVLVALLQHDTYCFRLMPTCVGLLCIVCTHFKSRTL